MKRSDSKTILVVDDEPDIQTFFCTALEDAGFRVLSASNGKAARRVLANNVVDLITIDLVMPSESGLDLYRSLRSEEPTSAIPVLVISAHARDDLGRRDFRDILRGERIPPPEAYLEKPVDPVLLVRTVAEILAVQLSPFFRPETDDLRDEILGLLRIADFETLVRVRDLLR